MEALKTEGFRLSPITLDDVRKPVHQALPHVLIKGVRRGDAMNVDSIAGMLVSRGRLLKEQPKSRK